MTARFFYQIIKTICNDAYWWQSFMILSDIGVNDGCGSVEPLFIFSIQMVDFTVVIIVDGWIGCRICIRSNDR